MADLLLRAEAGPPVGGSPPSFQLMFAPLFFGVILNVMLFGVFIVQVHAYFRLYKNDHASIRYLMYYLILMEVLNTIFDVGLIFEPLVLLRDSPLATMKSPQFLSADPIVTALISTPTQLFFAWRIQRITKSRWLSGFVGVLAFLSLASAAAATVGVAELHQFEQFKKIEAQLTVWLTATAFADLFITAFLVNFLWKNQTGYNTQTDSVTDKIILFTVQTGMITSFAAIADVTVFLILQNTSIQFIWDFSLSKLYSISLISTLIARTEWNNLLDEMPALKPADAESKGGSGSGNGKSNNSRNKDAIVRIRRATDIQGLQLYIPENFADFTAGKDSASATSPAARRRTPRTPRPIAVPLPPGLPADPRWERGHRTAAWAMSTGR